DLPDRFPVLLSLDAHPHNLPVQRTSFVGRAVEMAEVTRLLGETSLLTLTGAGGCGKTRLAVQVAADLLDDHPDGVWLVDLAGVAEGDLVPGAVATAVGLKEEPGRPLTDTVATFLARG